MTSKNVNQLEKETAEWVGKVAALDKLALKPKVIGPVLRKLADTDPRAARVLHRALKDANDAVVVPLAVAKTAEAKLTAMAKVYAVMEDISFESAYDKIMRTETGRALYRQYMEER